MREQKRLKSSQDLTVDGNALKSTDALSWNVFDSNGLTRVIDPDERNVLVCETVSSRRYSGQSLLCNALWAALSRCHSLRSLIEPILRMSQFLLTYLPMTKLAAENWIR